MEPVLEMSRIGQELLFKLKYTDIYAHEYANLDMAGPGA